MDETKFKDFIKTVFQNENKFQIFNFYFLILIKVRKQLLLVFKEVSWLFPAKFATGITRDIS